MDWVGWCSVHINRSTHLKKVIPEVENAKCRRFKIACENDENDKSMSLGLKSSIRMSMNWSDVSDSEQYLITVESLK